MCGFLYHIIYPILVSSIEYVYIFKAPRHVTKSCVVIGLAETLHCCCSCLCCAILSGTTNTTIYTNNEH